MSIQEHKENANSHGLLGAAGKTVAAAFSAHFVSRDLRSLATAFREAGPAPLNGADHVTAGGETYRHASLLYDVDVSDEDITKPPAKGWLLMTEWKRDFGADITVIREMITDRSRLRTSYA
ncbi:MAG TPA: hypothetical protein VHW24_28040, partial [Bryobacteraceae bacterium]|nr:hypothetical protein [Bryobacteraceae bacterium]